MQSIHARVWQKKERNLFPNGLKKSLSKFFGDKSETKVRYWMILFKRFVVCHNPQFAADSESSVGVPRYQCLVLILVFHISFYLFSFVVQCLWFYRLLWYLYVVPIVLFLLLHLLWKCLLPFRAIYVIGGESFFKKNWSLNFNPTWHSGTWAQTPEDVYSLPRFQSRISILKT